MSFDREWEAAKRECDRVGAVLQAAINELPESYVDRRGNRGTAALTQDTRASATQEGGTHYKTMGVQPWDVVDTWPREQQIGYYRGGALKYIMRMGSKDQEAQEIKKGQHYMRKLLEILESK